MNSRLNRALLATVLAGCVLAAGCGGLTASPTVSPLMFLVPGMGQVKPSPPPRPVTPLAPAETPQLAQVR